MKNTNEEEFLKQVNKIAALFSLGCEDIGEAIAIETLEWIRSSSNNIGQQAAILLQLVVAYGTPLTLSEREYYSEQLINLILNRFDEAILDSTLVHLIDSFDLVLHGVSQQFVERWSETVTIIMAYRKSTPSITVSASPLEEIVSLDDTNIPLDFSNKLVSASRLFHDDNFKSTSTALDPDKLITELRNELHIANRISVNSRKILNGEINYLELLAGVQTRQLPLMLRGAIALFNQPRRMSRSDKIIAAEVALRAVKMSPENTFGSLTQDIPAADFILEQINIIMNNSFIRFLALNIKNIQPLINVYLDIYLKHAPVDQRTFDILASFQGSFYSRCVRFTELHENPGHATLFVEELSQLLNHAQRESRLSNSENCLPNSILEQPINTIIDRPELKIRTESKENEILISLSDAQKYVTKSEAVFVYYCTDQNIYMLIIQEDFVKVVTLKAYRAEILTKYSEMKSNLHTLYLSEPDDYSWIYDKLLRPGIEHINIALTSSIVIVDAQMMLPFQLAYNTQSGKFLIDEYEVSYCYSLTTFCHSRRKSINNDCMRRILLSGFAGNDVRSRLPLVDQELSAIHDLAFQGGYQVSVPIDKFIDIERVSCEHDVFHFSGHITGNATIENAWTLHYRDGLVEPSKLLKILHPNIVLCSLLGCASAEHIGSSLIGSNGLLSMIVAWGIPNVIGFLWPVPDDIAARISIRFYENWLNQQGSVRQCLRRSLLEEERAWGPALWGSAVCYGA